MSPRVLNRVVVDSCPLTNYIALYTEENKSLRRHTQGSACLAFCGSFRINDLSMEGLRNWGIEGLKDKINKLKEIEFLQFLNP